MPQVLLLAYWTMALALGRITYSEKTIPQSSDFGPYKVCDLK